VATGTNPTRMRQINNALSFFRVFRSLGCKAVYIDGSFVSKKKYPEDIDLCFDLTGMDMTQFLAEFPKLFDLNEIGKIHRDMQCHIFTFEQSNTTFFDMLSQDRDGNLKGFVKINLKDLPIHYD
jgi:hypothetical protein